MYNATSIVGRLDGTLSYSDGSWSSFHAQIEDLDFNNEKIWSFDETVSESSIANIHTDTDAKAAMTALFSNLPFVTGFTWNNTDGNKTITGKVYHLYFLVTFDDGKTYPVSITDEKGVRTLHTSAATDLISDSTNKTDVLGKIKSMLEKIMDTVSIS